MKILWITNIVFPEASAKLMGKSDFRSSGGWMLGAADLLASRSDVKLYVATVSPLVTKLQRIEGERIVYYILPYGRGNLKPNPRYQEFWIKLKGAINPDIVHIHGTELSHGYEYMRACGANNVVISIQGMTSAYCYYHAGISVGEVYKNITLRDLLKGSIIRGKHKFKISSRYEVAMLKMANHIIGRTSWDRARTWAINPHAQYHFCNEILRPEFYDGSIWDYSKCAKHTIFLSQAGYPLKGLHQVLKAMPLILRHYPGAIIRIAGLDITKSASFKDLLHFTGYGRYIKRLIKQLNLQGVVKFVGNLNAEEMKQEYLNCNVFICPSSIENSPNSLGEAQILGVPCLASYVGGIPDMMVGYAENLYRFEEIEMLAHKVCLLFEKQDNFSDSLQKKSIIRHDATINDCTLFSIYQKIFKLYSHHPISKIDY